jgi:hypothetical protein
MTFIAPLFLVALAGLAIPVLLHLTQREKKQIIHFPSLMFVRRIPYQSVRRRKIHNWLLLFVRMAALAILIAAFARPFFDRPDAPVVPGAGAREVVVLLDASYSMGVGDRWSRAQASAREEIAKLGSADRVSVVLFASRAEILMRSSGERGSVLAAVDTAKPGVGATRYAPALKVAGGILAESTLPRREVVLVSDFQRGGWRGEEGSRLPAGVLLTPLPVGDVPAGANVSVTAVSLARSRFAAQERVAVTAGLVNRSERAVNGGMVALEVGGIPVASRPLSIEPGGTASVTFEPFTISGAYQRGTVRLPDDALAADNTFNFVVSPVAPIAVTLVDRGADAARLHVSQALAIGDAPRFEVVSRQAESVSDEDLRKSDVVVLHDAAVTSALARRLARYVEEGGGVFVATGPRSSWPADVDLLPASIGPPIDRTRGDVARVGGIEYAHPVFEAFRAPRSGDFTAVPVYGYRRLTALPEAQVIARFDAGAPAVLERRVGNGRVLMWGSTLDLSWNDLPKRSVYLPFVHSVVRHLAAYAEPRPWATVGEVLDAEQADPQAKGANLTVLTPSGRRVGFNDEGSEVLELAEQGFYELRGDTNQVAGVVASNVDPSEADLTTIDPKEILTAVAGDPSGTAEAQRARTPLTPEAKERNQRLWWYLLIAGVLVLGGETLLANRMSGA